MTLIFSIFKKFLLIATVISFTLVSASGQTLTNMVNQILDSHEDIVNAKKELEEADRDITDALLAYAPDLSVKYEGGRNDKYAASSNS
jgi:outer membrane protein TolC